MMMKQIFRPAVTSGWGDVPQTVLVTIYGDQNDDLARFSYEITGTKDPREACLAPHRMIAVCGRWLEAQPYARVLQVLDEAKALVKADGWQIAKAIEDVPSTGGVINDLKTVLGYPEVAGLGDFNAAHGFVFECEKPEKGFEWSKADIAKLEETAQQVLDLLSE